jgi:putative restriction endonuclease
VKRFDKLNVWKRGSVRAPHKPLLVLYALGRWQNGETQIPFSEAVTPLTELLRDFGPQRMTFHPEHPFWHLENDGVWKVESEIQKGPSAVSALRIGVS